MMRWTLLVLCCAVPRPCFDDDEGLRRDIGQLLSSSYLIVYLLDPQDPLVTCENLVWTDGGLCGLEQPLDDNCPLSCGKCDYCQDSDAGLVQELNLPELQCRVTGYGDRRASRGTSGSSCHDERVRNHCPFSCGSCGCKDDNEGLQRSDGGKRSCHEKIAADPSACYDEGVQQHCPKSCGLCWCRDRNILLRKRTGQQYRTCQSVVQDNGCSKFELMMKELCPMSCGFCKPCTDKWRGIAQIPKLDGTYRQIREPCITHRTSIAMNREHSDLVKGCCFTGGGERDGSSATTEVSTTTANTTTTTTTTTVGLAVSWVAGQNCDPATCRDGAACKPINATLTTYVDFDDCSYNKDKCLCWQHFYSSTGTRSRMMVNYDESCCAIHNGYDCANPNGTAHTCVRAHKCFSVANSSEPCGDKVDANTCKCMKTCADTHDRSKCRVLPGDVRDTSCCAQRGLASCADGYTLSLGRKGCGGVNEDVLLVFSYYGTCCTPPACEEIRNEADCEDPCVWNDSGEDGEKCGAQTTPI